MGTYLPRFQHGTGSLTADVLNAAMDSARATEHENWDANDQRLQWGLPRVCKITASANMAGASNRWTYALAEVDFTATDTQAAGTNAWENDDGTGTGTAKLNGINLAECANTATVVAGIPVANLPPTFALQPIADDSIVMVWISGLPAAPWFLPVFSLQNMIDGECP